MNDPNDLPFFDTEPTFIEQQSIPLSVLQKYAKLNRPWAQIQLGKIYVTDRPSRMSKREADVKAFVWFKRAADQGDCLGQFLLGGGYENGRGVKKNVVSAHHWYGLSAAQGNSLAAERLTHMTNSCSGEYFDEQRAKRTLEQARERNKLKNDKSQSPNADSIDLWEDNAPDDAEEMTLRKLKRFTKKNKSWALFELGCRYHEGDNGMAINYTQAAKYFRKAIAQDGHPYAACSLSFIHFHGQIDSASKAKAVQLYHTAALKGYHGRLFELTLTLGGHLTLSFEILFDVYTKAAAKERTQAYFLLARAYLNGQGCNVSLTKAKEWVLKSINEREREIKSIGDEIKEDGAESIYDATDIEAVEKRFKPSMDLLVEIDAKIDKEHQDGTTIEEQNDVVPRLTNSGHVKETSLPKMIANSTPTITPERRKKKKKKPLCCRFCGIQHTKTERLKRCLFCCDRDAVHCSWKCKLEDWPKHQEFCIRVGTALHDCSLKTFNDEFEQSNAMKF